MHSDFALSGEPVAEQVSQSYGTEPIDEASASKIARTNVEKREYQKEYMEYWNSTRDLTGTGRPADAFIMPLAPFAAARPKAYSYYGYSTVINTLDYTSCVIPVTIADKSIDELDKGFKPANAEDKRVSESCECQCQIDKIRTYSIFQTIQISMTVLTSRCSLLGDGCKRRKCSPSPSTLVALLKHLNECILHYSICSSVIQSGLSHRSHGIASVPYVPYLRC